jgi:ABC-2 type transport system ATP-binding protein
VLHVGLIDADTAKRAAIALASIGSKPPHVEDKVVEITVEEGPKMAMDALRLLDQERIEPTTFSLREPSLDDVFLALTGRRAEGDAADHQTTSSAAPNRTQRTTETSGARS